MAPGLSVSTILHHDIDQEAAQNKNHPHYAGRQQQTKSKGGARSLTESNLKPMSRDEERGEASSSSFHEPVAHGEALTHAEIELQDHFTLGSGITPLRFRDRNIHVIQEKNHQIVLEQRRMINPGDEGEEYPQYTVKRASIGNFGLTFLRLLYTTGAIVMAGFVFAASIDILLHIFLSIATDLYPRNTDVEADVGFAVIQLLAVPVLVHSLANAITLAIGFVADVWDGFIFFRNIGWWGPAWSEWVGWIAFTFCPLLALVASIFRGSDNWWHSTALTMFFGYLSLYCIYSLAVLFYECKAAGLIIRGYGNVDSNSSFIHVARQLLLVRVRFTMSIYQDNSYSVAHDQSDNLAALYSEDRNPEKVSMTWFSFILSCGGTFMGLYERLQPPIRIWSLAESLEAVPFFTSAAWSLSGLCCASTSRATVSIVSGPGSLSPVQWISSAICIVLSIILVGLTIIAVLWYYEVSVAVWVFVLVIVCALVATRVFRAVRTLIDVFRRKHTAKPNYNETQQQDVGLEEEDSHIYYQVWETMRIAQPRQALIWFILVVELVVFYILPWAALLYTENYPLAVLFIILALISAIRHYCSPRILLREYGHWAMQAIGAGSPEQRRLEMMVTRISRHSVRVCLVLVLTIASIIAFALLIVSAYDARNGNSSSSSSDSDLIFLSDFELPSPELPYNLYYPTCRIDANAQSDDVTTGALGLVDMAFLSYVAYVDEDGVQDYLDSWFGSDVAYFQRNFSESYLEDSTSPVSYYLISFPNSSADVVSVRGTVTAMDAFTDLQLWFTALIFQALRAVVPFGGLMTTIIPNLVYYVSKVEAANIEDVSYYREVTSFVEDAMEVRNNSRFLLTGHSLGGGLAIISGAQLKVLTVAISGVNAMLSRKTFDPPIEPEDLNQYTFNVVPDSDPIPRVDDLARLYQRIECGASGNSIFACHAIARTLCEILYRCGGRVPLCHCTTDYGYPEPSPIGNRTFEEACQT